MPILEQPIYTHQPGEETAIPVSVRLVEGSEVAVEGILKSVLVHFKKDLSRRQAFPALVLEGPGIPETGRIGEIMLRGSRDGLLYRFDDQPPFVLEDPAGATFIPTPEGIIRLR